MIHLIESFKDRTAHDKHDGLFYGMPLTQEDTTILGSLGRFIDGEVNMSKVESMI